MDLINAIKNGNQKLAFHILRQKTIDINTTDKLGNTALLLSCYQRKHHHIAIKIINEYNNVNLDIENNARETALSVAFHYRYRKIIKILLNHGANTNFYIEGKTNIIRACENNWNSEAIQLISKNRNLNNELDAQDNLGQTALIIATKNRLKDVIEHLIEKSVNIHIQDKTGTTALMHACMHKNKDIILKLIDAGANIDIQNNNSSNALMIACTTIASYSHFTDNIILKLISLTYDINVQDNDGNTVLMQLAINTSKKCTVILEIINKGANINLVNKKKQNALMLFSKYDQEISPKISSIMKILIEKTNDINLQDIEGNTALLYYVNRKTDNQFLDLYLNNKANINIRNSLGFNILYYISGYNEKHIIRKIFDLDIDICNSTSQNTLYLICYRGYEDIAIEFIEKRLCKNKIDNYDYNDILYYISTITPCMVKLFDIIIEKNVDVNIVRVANTTLLSKCINKINNDIEMQRIILKLIEKKANINTICYDGINQQTTFLRLLCEIGSEYFINQVISIVKTEFDFDKNPNILIITSEREMDIITMKLIEYGAKVPTDDMWTKYEWFVTHLSNCGINPLIDEHMIQFGENRARLLTINTLKKYIMLMRCKYKNTLIDEINNDHTVISKSFKNNGDFNILSIIATYIC